LAEVPAPIQQGADDSSATRLTFDLTAEPSVPGAAEINPAPITLFDAVGQAYEPVRQRNVQTGVEAYRIKPAGASNRTAESIEETDIVAVARALLIDRRPVRIAPKGSTAANFLTFGAQKLVRYVLNPDIAAALGIPAASDHSSMPAYKAIPMPMEPHPVSKNLILYGPPGTGKTYETAREAVLLCNGVAPDTRKEVMSEYARLTAAGRIEFVPFHQSYSYEEFVEGLRPVESEDGSPGFGLTTKMGVLRRLARRAETSSGTGGSSTRMPTCL
jgi:5-methylcytosine-specific restriction enzyme B